MHLGPRELDKLVLHGAGFLAQKRLARGLRLRYPEAIALLATQLLELIRDGRRVADLMDVGRRILGRAQVLDGVAEMIHEVQVEGTFPDGTKLVTVHHPIALMQGDLALALYGSFLPVPDAKAFPDVATKVDVPGAVTPEEGTIVLNEGRDTLTLKVVSRGDRPIQVGSHYPFDETNQALDFDRASAVGKRLDIPAGTAVRFEPGDEKTVNLVAVVTDDTDDWSTASQRAADLLREAESAPFSRRPTAKPPAMKFEPYDLGAVGLDVAPDTRRASEEEMKTELEKTPENEGEAP